MRFAALPVFILVIALLGGGAAAQDFEPVTRLTVPMLAADSAGETPPAGAWTVTFREGNYVLVAADEELVVAATAPVFPQFTEGHRALVALDPADGSERWRLELACAPFQPVLTDAAVLYVCSDGSVNAVSREDGSPLWSEDPGTAPYLPVVAGGLVLLGDADPEDDYGLDGSDPPRLLMGVVVALELATGDEAWRVDTGRDSVFVTADGPVTYLGTRTWTACGEPGADDELCSGDVIAVETATGEELWRTATGWASAPVVLSPHGPISGGGNYLFGLTPAGDVRWFTGVPGGGTWESPLLMDGVVVAGTNVNAIHGLDADTGAVAWTLPYCDCAYRAQPYLGRVLVDGAGGLFVIEPGSAQVPWGIAAEDLYQPAVVGGTIYAGSHGAGTLTVFR
ncbi:MAG: PQQ-binding-like beta-propeller repeat protein [Dehalococcoidia bacterium]|nr:PQQ-binding-like beta-propeller repeat protein [Dehalococcoidia bacterium]